MVNKKIMLIAPGLVFGAVVMAAEAAPELTSGFGQVEFHENVGKQAVFFETTKLVKLANEHMLEGKYRDAIANYRQIVERLKDKGGKIFQDRVAFCRKRIEDCYFRMADEAMKRADELVTSYDFENAIKLCREAQQYCPERREELAKKIVYYETRRNRAVAREDASVSKTIPNFDAQEYQIQLLLEEGIAFANRQEYEKALRKFQEVLLLDPYNADAMQNAMGVNTRIRNAAGRRFNATARHMVGEVEWSAAVPIVAEAPIGKPKNELIEPVVKEEMSELEKRLRSIIIPNFALYDKVMSFDEAMEDLGRQAEEHDPLRRGINFVIRDVPRKEGEEAPKLGGYSPGRASLYDILRALQVRGDLSFKIDKNAVIIAAKGIPLEKSIVRTFSFALAPDDSEESLKNALRAGAGVEFGPDTKLTLFPARNEVISRNTPENQKLIGEYFAKRRSLNVPMVQIMFKFLEVAQNDLDELGFNWHYSRGNSRTSFSAGGNALLRHYANEDGNDRYGGSGVTSTLTNDSRGRASDNDATYNFFWHDGKNALLASVFALDWADSSDILYSPRVTTLAGTTAKVNMTEKHYYPGDYDDIDNEATERVRVFVTQPQPTLDDEKDLGIMFNITPNVRGELISAHVHFDIKQFDSWLIVDSRNPDNDDDDGEYQKKAVINTRYIDTDVTLKDGETVLIGSISQDLTTTMHDKIPILSDIPFIGRFFQSKYTTSKKNNLLVFMTCRLVLPDGSAAIIDPKTEQPKNTSYQRGVPVFPRNI